MKRRKIIAVIGAGQTGRAGYEKAREVGRQIAQSGAALLCGGLGGIMEAASRGCSEAGGLVIGVLPGPEPEEANPYVEIALPTNMGHARNVVIAHSAHALVAVEGEYGTLSEMAVALKLGRPVVTLDCRWRVEGAQGADSPEEAVAMALERIKHS
ncbi:MAG: TIGR00725 family protein [Desulfuromonadales bacterium]|nr:TIGR00725 family protein [Desulfuromonadales bacterium]NIR34325.1 TIGR00725 family protein [Desulfuromonadales bacterium]NIS41759.1 TIGR00725 family protein [Desulfuromonadales bacterium]